MLKDSEIPCYHDLYVRLTSSTDCIDGCTFAVQAPMAVGEAPTVAAGGLAPAPALGSSNSAGIGMSTGSVFFSMILAVYFY